jgi:putative SOS response-associated peptidase YedK
MCGRYRLSRRKQLVEEYFDAGSGDEDWAPRCNIAPTQPSGHSPKSEGTAPGIVAGPMGLIPSWAKDASGAARMINARSETAATKPAFRDPCDSVGALSLRTDSMSGRGWARTSNRIASK